MARVLVVDDESSIRVTVGHFLTQVGHTVEVAANATEADTRLAAGDFDVVVTDIVLPGVTGVDLLHAIRRMAPHVKVIMMTGEPTIETAAEAVRAGALDYLSKPVTKADIQKAVAHAANVKALEDERQRLETQNLHYQTNLERLVAERTRELESSNRHLRETMDTLQRVQQQVIQQERLKALGQLVSGIAHDFNNVLVPILGMTDYLLSDPKAMSDPEERRCLLETVRSAAKDAREIVRRLREFYRPDAKTETAPTDLAALVRDVAVLTEPLWGAQAQAEGRTIQVATDLATAPTVDVNAAQIREVLTNLIINATQAMPEGGSIRIALGVEDEWATLRVVDEGIGMPEDTLRRCVEPFFTTKGDAGTGLGLSVCHGVIQRHGGRMDIESRVGEGTRVTIRLPLTARSAADPTPPPAGAPPGLRVLAADDEAWSRELLMKYLVADGHTVETAANGSDAVRMFADTTPAFDLVITDRSMPGMSGDGVAARVKALSPGTRVIMLTGFGDLLASTGETPDGVDVLVSKPVTRDELAAAIRQALE